MILVKELLLELGKEIKNKDFKKLNNIFLDDYKLIELTIDNPDKRKSNFVEKIEKIDTKEIKIFEREYKNNTDEIVEDKFILKDNQINYQLNADEYILFGSMKEKDNILNSEKNIIVNKSISNEIIEKNKELEIFKYVNNKKNNKENLEK